MSPDELDPKGKVEMMEVAETNVKIVDSDAQSIAAPLRSHFADLTAAQVRHKFLRLYLFGLSVSIGGLYVGYTTVAPGNIVANPGFIKMMGTVTNPLTGALELSALHVSLWSGCTFAGQAAGMLMTSFTGDYFGRKATFYFMTVLMIASIILEMTSNEWKAFLAGKILGGISTGLAIAGSMTYLAEISMPQTRGTLIGAYAMGYSGGQLPCAIGLEVLEKTAPLAFRRIFYSEFVIVGLWLIPLFLLPESPVWLAKNGKHERAKKALKFLVGKVEGFDIEHEYGVILSELEASQAALANRHNQWRSVFSGVNLKRSWITTIVFTSQLFMGVPLVYGTTTYFFQIAGLQDPFIANLIITILTVVFVAIGNFIVVERVGRRKMILFATCWSIAMCTIIGILGCFPITPKLAGALIAVCALWVCVYSATFAPVSWMTLGEIPTPALRQKTIAFASVFNACVGTMFNYIIPLLLSAQYAGWGTKIGFFFAGVSIPWLIITYIFLPETKDRSFAALDELFESGVSFRKFAQTPTAAEDGETGTATVAVQA